MIRNAGTTSGSMGTSQGFQRSLPVRWNKADGFYAEGLTHFPVSEAEQTMELFRKGIKNRVVAGHQMNAASSRSHCLFTLSLEVTVPGEPRGTIHAPRFNEDGIMEPPTPPPPTVISSTITLVDLAGSERVSQTEAKGSVLDESISINKSLFVLRQVIKSLSDRSLGADVKVPYRDSKLTSLLSNSLGGDAITLMIACIQSSDDFIEDSYRTLSYATWASTIVNAPRVNLDPNQAKMIHDLRSDVSQKQGNTALMKAAVNGVR